MTKPNFAMKRKS